MNLNVFFLEMQAYGNFDVPYTEIILYRTQPFNANELLREYCRNAGLDNAEVTGGKAHVGKELREHTAKFIEFLKNCKGFKAIKTAPVIFCD